MKDEIFSFLCVPTCGNMVSFKNGSVGFDPQALKQFTVLSWLSLPTPSYKATEFTTLILLVVHGYLKGLNSLRNKPYV